MLLEELREPFHHWVRTVRFPIQDGELGEALPHVPASQDHSSSAPVGRAEVEQARELWEEISLEMRDELKRMAKQLNDQLEAQLKSKSKEALKEERERFRHRLQEVERAMKETTIQKLEKERAQILSEMQQLSLLVELQRDLEERLRDLEDELRRRRGHYQALLDQLKGEQSRVMERILPQRYRLRGQAQVFPVTVEIRLREG